MEQPRGFVDPQFSDHVCRLHKTLYGLKQAPRAWYYRLSQALLDIGFGTSAIDSSLFILSTPTATIYVLVSVDDILITGTDKSIIFLVIKQLQQSFAIKDLGDLGYFLGMEAHRTSDGLHLRQSKYILDLLHCAGMIGAKP